MNDINDELQEALAESYMGVTDNSSINWRNYYIIWYSLIALWWASCCGFSFAFAYRNETSALFLFIGFAIVTFAVVILLIIRIIFKRRQT